MTGFEVPCHFVVARDFALGDADTSAFILKSIKAAFAEDVFALESVARVRREDLDVNFAEKSVISDRAGVTLRRLLRSLAEREIESPS